MTTAKEALLKAGRIQAITRGRISKENHEWLNDQIKNHGLVISDSKATTTVKVVNGVTDKVVIVATPNPEYRSMDEMRYPLDMYIARDTDGNTYSMREACQPCGYSLVDHRCEDPIVLGKRVTIERVS